MDTAIAWLVFVVAFTSYVHTLQYDLLVSWDDVYYVTKNPLIRDFSLSGLARLWSQFYLWHYSPVTLMSYMLDFRIWEVTPRGYHLTNVLLHAINGMLVFAVGRCLRLGRWVAALAALLFVIHPLQVESVAWVSERKNVLSTCFFLLAFVTHTQRDRVRWLPWWLSWLWYALSVFSKPATVGGPVVLMAYDRYWRGCNWRQALARSWLPCCLGLAVAILTLIAQESTPRDKLYWGNSPWLTALLMLRVIWEYAVSIVVPIDLDPYYFYTYVPGMFWSDPRVWLGGGVLLGLGLLGWRQPMGQPLSRFAVLWIVVFFLPVANLVPFPFQRADRYLYVPSVMILLLVGVAVKRLWHLTASWRARACMVCGLSVACGLLVMLTVQRHAIWSNSGTLWRSHLETYPDSHTGLLNLGVYYYYQNDYPQAYPLFRKLVRLRPGHLDANRYLAESAMRMGEVKTAIQVYEAAILRWPQEKKLFNDLGWTYHRTGRLAEAYAHYVKALVLDPGYELARINLLNLGRLAIQTQHYELAHTVFQDLVRRDPAYAAAVGGVCLSRVGLRRYADAIEPCQTVVRLAPTHGYYQHVLAQVMLRVDRPDDALKWAQQAVKTEPDSAVSHRVLGDVYTALGDVAQARAAYQTALEVNPKEPFARQHMQALPQP